MAINKTITLTWEGEEYPIIMTMRNIDRIEEDINLMKFTQQCMAGDIRMSHACKFISIVLGFGGCYVTQEEVYEKVYGDADVTIHDVNPIIMEILDACFPQVDQKKTDPPKKKTSLKNTRGKRSTN